MQSQTDAILLRILIGESDRWGHSPLFEALVIKAREAGMAGALVLRGPMGFGAGSQIHTAKILQLSMDLPVVIEIIDTKEKVDAFLPTVSSMVNGGLVTVQPVTIVHAAVAEKKRQG